MHRDQLGCSLILAVHGDLSLWEPGLTSSLQPCTHTHTAAVHTHTAAMHTHTATMHTNTDAAVSNNIQVKQCEPEALALWRFSVCD